MFAWTKPDGTPGTMVRLCKLNTTAVLSWIALMAAAFEHLSRWKEPCEVEVYAGSQQAVMAVDQWIPQWSTNGWINAKGEPVNAWYKELAMHMTGHVVHCTTQKGEYSSWLETNMKHTRGDKACLISLESLTAQKS